MTFFRPKPSNFFYFTLFANVLLMLACCQSKKGERHNSLQKNLKLSLKNSSTFTLKEKAVIVKRNELHEIPEGTIFPLLTSKNGDTIPAQLDDLDGDGKWDELFFLMDFPAKGESLIKLKWITKKINFKKRTNVRFGVRNSMESRIKPAVSDTFYANELPGVLGFERYQTDGPSWENDKVGFRDYLDGRNSKDVFGKKISGMSPDSVGINKQGVTEDNYHVMENWGRDILSVGNSIGIGGFGLKIGGDLARLGVTEEDSLNNVSETSFEVLASGPIRSLMKYEYINWHPEKFNRKYEVHELTSIWPGMYAFKNQVSFTGLKGDEKAVIGLVNSNTKDSLTQLNVGDYVVLFTHDKQTYKKEWFLGLALLIPKENFLGFSEAPEKGRFSQSYLAEMSVKNNQPIDYYAVAAWEIADPRFADRNYFKNYLIDLADRLSAKISVSVTD